LAIDPLERIIEAASQKGILKLVLPKAANLIMLFPLCRRCGNIHKPNYLGASSLTQNNLDFFLGVLTAQNQHIKVGNLPHTA
jgi:hypothetical protein